VAVAVIAYVWYKSPFGIADLGTLPCFMLGIVAADLLVRGHARHAIWLPAAMIVLAITTFVDGSLDHGAPIWQAAAFLIVVAGLGVGSKAMSWWPFVFVGAASYSIYLVHGPIMTWLVHRGLDPLLAGGVGIGTGVLFWVCVESPTLKMSPRFRLPVTVPDEKRCLTNRPLET
jgi:peptidoglycan/LPS O-acetylase OafA/YrhL